MLMRMRMRMHASAQASHSVASLGMPLCRLTALLSAAMPNTCGVCAPLPGCRLYQRYTFRLAEGREQEPLPLRAGITLSPKNGVWVTAHKRHCGA